MKRLNKMFATLLAIACIFTACNKEENTGNDGMVNVRFSAQIGTESGEIIAQSRASDTDWENGDAIGIYMVKNGTNTIAMEAENREYTTDGDGTFTAAGEDIFFPVNGSDKFDFIAYYPYKESGTGQDKMEDFMYPVNLSDQSKPANIDLLHATTYRYNTTGYDKNDPDVNFLFEHKLCKFVIKTTPGDGLKASDLEEMTFLITGMNTEAYFNLKDATLRNYKATVSSIAAYTQTKGIQYEAILLPATSVSKGQWQV
ncbi:MAG: fimbrillin family protein [Tannerellaceae bacterium]|nr:fimbrillin family protein [Tannerellaceae bacterium]